MTLSVKSYLELELISDVCCFRLSAENGRLREGEERREEKVRPGVDVERKFNSANCLDISPSCLSQADSGDTQSHSEVDWSDSNS